MEKVGEVTVTVHADTSKASDELEALHIKAKAIRREIWWLKYSKPLLLVMSGYIVTDILLDLLGFILGW